MNKFSDRIIITFISLVTIFFGIAAFISADEKTSVKLLIDDVTFISKYRQQNIQEWIENYPGDLNIKIINEGIKPSPKAKLVAELRYTYPRTESSGVINPPQSLNDRLKIAQIDLPPIIPNEPMQQKISTSVIELKGPPINNTVTLNILIYDLNDPGNILYSKDYMKYTLATESVIRETITNKKQIFILAGTLIVALIISIAAYFERKRRQRRNFKYQSAEQKNNSGKANSSSTTDNEFTEAYGPGRGGYIIIDLPENQKALFHDVLKGFEEYAQIKGYKIQFSVDNTLSNKIAFKFTIADSGITVSTDRVTHDLKEYIRKVQEGDPLDDMPIIIPEPAHQALLLAMRNRISFLQNTYLVQQNAIRFYENMMDRLSKQNFGVFPSQNFYLQAGGHMGDTNYSAINSPGAIQGKSHHLTGNIIGANIYIGASANDRKNQADLIQEFINQLQSTENINSSAKVAAQKYLDKVKDEILEEEHPDQNRIAKWLDRAKSFLNTIVKAGELYDKVKEVFSSFHLQF